MSETDPLLKLCSERGLCPTEDDGEVLIQAPECGCYVVLRQINEGWRQRGDNGAWYPLLGSPNEQVTKLLSALERQHNRKCLRALEIDRELRGLYAELRDGIEPCFSSIYPMPPGMWADLVLDKKAADKVAEEAPDA